MMSIKPFLLITILLLANGIFIDNCYKLWFRTDKYYTEIRKAAYKSPAWYPFRNYQLSQIEEKKSWVLQQKISLGIFGLILIIFDVASIFELVLEIIK